MAAQQLAVMTYNVYVEGWKDTDKATETVDVIVNSGADLICLQESNHHWEKRLQGDERIRNEFAHRVFCNDKWPHGGRAFLSKFPLVSKPDYFSNRLFWGWYGAWRVDVEVDSGTTAESVQVLGVHLRAPFPSNPFVVQKQRLAEIKAHVGVLDDVRSRPTIILGDFNTPGNLCTDFLETTMGLTNAFRACQRQRTAQGPEPPVTWHWRRFGQLYDHIFTSSHLRATDAAIIPSGGSDHWPIRARFQLTP